MSFPFVKQHDAMQCGISCIAMICLYYGKIQTLSKSDSKQFRRQQHYIIRHWIHSAKNMNYRTING